MGWKLLEPWLRSSRGFFHGRGALPSCQHLRWWVRWPHEGRTETTFKVLRVRAWLCAREYTTVKTGKVPISTRPIWPISLDLCFVFLRRWLLLSALPMVIWSLSTTMMGAVQTGIVLRHLQYERFQICSWTRWSVVFSNYHAARNKFERFRFFFNWLADSNSNFVVAEIIYWRIRMGGAGEHSPKMENQSKVPWFLVFVHAYLAATAQGHGLTMRDVSLRSCCCEWLCLRNYCSE